MLRKVLISLPPAMLEEADHVASIEHRTRSDLIREALRRYLTEFKKNNSAQAPSSYARDYNTAKPATLTVVPESPAETKPEPVNQKEKEPVTVGQMAGWYSGPIAE